MLGVLAYGLYLLGKVFIPKLAENDVFFSSPKLGRIKARRRSGRIVSFIDNLVGKGKHVDKDTGKIKRKEEPPTGFWWKLFGVRFIGLDDVYKYRIATEAIEDNKGELSYTEVEASSIYLEGSYPLTAILMTSDGVRLKVKLQLKLSTVDAAKALSLPISWTILVFAAVLGASRDFFGAREVETLIKAQNEGDKVKIGSNDIENSGFVDLILSLNTPKAGNIPLGKTCGQHINAINLVDIDFADEDTKKAFSAPFEARKAAQKTLEDAKTQADATIIKSEATLKAAKNTADARIITGKAEATVYDEKNKALGGDPKATADVMMAELRGPQDKVTTFANVVIPGLTK